MIRFQCSLCKKIFNSPEGWTKEKAEKEYLSFFKERLDIKDAEFICGKCYNQFKMWYNSLSLEKYNSILDEATALRYYNAESQKDLL